MDRAESGGAGSRSESGSWTEAGKGGESPGGSPAGRLGPVPPTTCLSTCSQGGGSTCWAKVKKLPELCPVWGCCIPAREDRGPTGSSVWGGRLQDSHGGAGKVLAWQEEV